MLFTLQISNSRIHYLVPFHNRSRHSSHGTVQCERFVFLDFQFDTFGPQIGILCKGYHLLFCWDENTDSRYENWVSDSTHPRKTPYISVKSSTSNLKLTVHFESNFSNFQINFCMTFSCASICCFKVHSYFVCLYIFGQGVIWNFLLYWQLWNKTT